MTIGEAARRAGIQASAIRYYERVGLLPRPVRVSGRRSYDGSILDLLGLVRFARETGFSMREVKALFGPQHQGQPISARWRSLARAKVSEIDRHLANLKTARELLRRVMACRCVEPAQCGRQLRALSDIALLSAPTSAGPARRRGQVPPRPDP